MEERLKQLYSDPQSYLSWLPDDHGPRQILIEMLQMSILPGTIKPANWSLTKEAEFDPNFGTVNLITIDRFTNNIIVSFFGTHKLVILNSDLEIIKTLELYDDGDEKTTSDKLNSSRPCVHPNYMIVSPYGNQLLVTCQDSCRLFVFSMDGDYIKSVNLECNASLGFLENVKLGSMTHDHHGKIYVVAKGLIIECILVLDRNFNVLETRYTASETGFVHYNNITDTMMFCQPTRNIVTFDNYFQLSTLCRPRVFALDNSGNILVNDDMYNLCKIYNNKYKQIGSIERPDKLSINGIAVDYSGGIIMPHKTNSIARYL